jgi:hypothetical protein
MPEEKMEGEELKALMGEKPDSASKPGGMAQA